MLPKYLVFEQILQTQRSWDFWSKKIAESRPGCCAKFLWAHQDLLCWTFSTYIIFKLFTFDCWYHMLCFYFLTWNFPRLSLLIFCYLWSLSLKDHIFSVIYVHYCQVCIFKVNLHSHKYSYFRCLTTCFCLNIQSSFIVMLIYLFILSLF